MLLYHGSNMAVEKPEVNAGRRALDFGAGFYLTSNRDQAERWAQAVVRRRQSGCAMLNCFEFEETKIDLLKVLKFDGPNSDWFDGQREVFLFRQGGVPFEQCILYVAASKSICKVPLGVA